LLPYSKIKEQGWGRPVTAHWTTTFALESQQMSAVAGRAQQQQRQVYDTKAALLDEVFKTALIISKTAPSLTSPMCEICKEP
jgi:hypothetical protein